MKKFIYLFLLPAMLLSACSQKEETDQPQDNAPLVEETNLEKQEVNDAENNKVENTDNIFVEGLSYESPEWEGLKADIEKQTGEMLASFYAPASATDKNIIYVSTEGDYIGNFPDGKQVNKIYSYSLTDKTLTEIYKEEESRTLRGMGRDGDKLVLMLDMIDNSPGPCFSIWSEWKAFASLNLSRPEAGLSDYTVPESLIEKGKKEQEECKKETWPEMSGEAAQE